MKKLIWLLLIECLAQSCIQTPTYDTYDLVLNLDISLSKWNKFLQGSNFNKKRGILVTKNNVRFKFLNNNGFVYVEIDSLHLENCKMKYILNDTYCEYYIPDTIRSIKTKIQLNTEHSINCFIIPVGDALNLEKLEHRVGEFVSSNNLRTDYSNFFNYQMPHQSYVNPLYGTIHEIPIFEFSFPSKTGLLKKEKMKISPRINGPLHYSNSSFLFEDHTRFSGDTLTFFNCTFDGQNTYGMWIDSAFVQFSQCTFKNLTNYEGNGVKHPSCFTISHSNATLVNCTLRDNKSSDDLINFYRSNFTMDHCHLTNSFGDAVDGDFSNGTIFSCDFTTIGNDGIDFSGSKIEVSDCVFQKVADKAVSIGENSQILIDSCNFFSCALGIVIKDGSTARIHNSEFSSCELDLVLYNKKEFFSEPTFFSYNTIFDKALCDEKLKIDNKDIVELFRAKKVEKLMYGNQYGKASLR